MTDCEKITGLISAYYDGELTADERELVRRHLDTCDSCAALLRLFADVTDALDDTKAPAELRMRVMGSVMAAESAPRRAEKSRLYVLRRFAPAAACLAVVMLALALLQTLGGRKDAGMEMTASGSSPAASMQAASAPEAAPREAGDGESYVYGEMSKEFRIEIAEDENGADAEPKTFGGSMNDAPDSANSGAAMPSTAPSAPPGQAIPAETPPPQTPIPTEETAPQLVTGNTPDNELARDEDLSAYYAVIKLLPGGVPLELSDYECIDAGDGGLRVYIPRDVAETLIAEGCDYVLYNENATEAVVLFTASGG